MKRKGNTKARLIKVEKLKARDIKALTHWHPRVQEVWQECLILARPNYLRKFHQDPQSDPATTTHFYGGPKLKHPRTHQWLWSWCCCYYCWGYQSYYPSQKTPTQSLQTQKKTKNNKYKKKKEKSENILQINQNPVFEGSPGAKTSYGGRLHGEMLTNPSIPGT